jgi:hypothetical protein
MSSKIFISHRHDEKNIADIINKHLQMWGIPKNEIFQSSDSRSGTRIGGKLTDVLKNALSKTNLLIFVYTHRVYDWSYCMWECGVALNPETEDTNIVVFECAGETPKVFHSSVRVVVDQQGIEKFTNQFHKNDNFFPGKPPYNAEIENDILIELAERLYEDLLEEIPGLRYTESPLVHQLKLSLDSAHVDKVLKMKSPKAANQYIYEHLIIEEASPYLSQHFGCRTINKDINWSMVVQTWKDDIKIKNAKAPITWTRELNREIWRAINNKPAKPEGNVIISAARSTRKYCALVCLMREYPGRKMEFNVYFYQKK